MFEIEEDKLEEYHQAEGVINDSEIDVVSFQHEFGLFGGPDGTFITEFLKRKMPIALVARWAGAVFPGSTWKHLQM